MALEQSGLISSWFSRFRHGKRKAGKSRNRAQHQPRRALLEALEPRNLLVATVYVDFGSLMGDFDTNVGNLARFDDRDPAQTPQYVFGPILPYGNNQPITLIPFSDVVADKGIQFDDGPVSIDESIEFQDGAEPQPGPAGKLQASILNMIARQFAPLNMQVVATAARSDMFYEDIRTDLSFNNPVLDPATQSPDPEADFIRGPLFDPMRLDPDTGLPVGYKDVYILIVGVTRTVGDQIVQVGDDAAIFAAGEPNLFTTFAFPNDPDFPDEPLIYSDGGGIVCWDTVVDRALAGNLNPNVAAATLASQTAGISYGQLHTSTGLPWQFNPFFDADVQLINGSDIMREGRSNGLAVYPTLTDMPFFSRFDLMLGDFNQEPTLTQNAYDFWVDNIDVGPAMTINANDEEVPVGYITGTGGFDRITITRIDDTMAQVTVDAYRDNSFSPGSLIASTSYMVNHTGLLLIEGGRNQDIIEVDPTLTPLFGIEVFGGHAVDRFEMRGNGTQGLTVTPLVSLAPTAGEAGNPIGFNGDRRFDTQIHIFNGSTFQTSVFVQEFDDNSALFLDGYDSLFYRMPRFLGAKYRLDTASGRMIIDGTAGPTALSPVVGVANVEFTNVAHVMLDLPLGATSDTLTIRARGALPAGLQSVQINLGPGSDRLIFDDSGSSRSLDYIVTPTLVNYDSLPGFLGFSYNGVENLEIIGTQGKNTFVVTPSLATAYRINGRGPSTGSLPDGDFLDMQLAGVPGRHLNFTGPGAGVWSFSGGYKSVTFSDIERYFSSTIVLSGSSDGGTASKPVVRVFDANTHELLFSINAYESSFKGGVRVATADMNGDGIADIITAPGVGRVGTVRVFDGATGQSLGLFHPEGDNYKNGLHVAVGDVDGDGDFEIITSVGRGQSMVRVFRATLQPNDRLEFNRVKSWRPYASNVITGAVVASADTNGNGRDEVITAPGAGVSAMVRIFDGRNGNKIREFLAFESSFRNGISLAAGDADGDGRAEIFAGAGAGGGARVRVFTAGGSLRRQFTAFGGDSQNAPVRLAAVDPFEADRVMLYAAQASSGTTKRVKLFDPLTATAVDTFVVTDSSFNGGVNIG